MKPTTINVQITKNPKQYEAVRLGIEASLDAGETVDDAIKAATAQLNSIYEEMYCGGQKTQQNAEEPAKNEPRPKEGEPAKKELLHFGDSRVQAIVTRIEKNPEKKDEIMKNVRKYYELDEQAEHTILLACKFN